MKKIPVADHAKLPVAADHRQGAARRRADGCREEDLARTRLDLMGIVLSIIWGALLLANNLRYHDKGCSAKR